MHLIHNINNIYIYNYVYIYIYTYICMILLHSCFNNRHSFCGCDPRVHPWRTHISSTLEPNMLGVRLLDQKILHHIHPCFLRTFWPGKFLLPHTQRTRRHLMLDRLSGNNSWSAPFHFFGKHCRAHPISPRIALTLLSFCRTQFPFCNYFALKNLKSIKDPSSSPPVSLVK